MDVHYKIRIVEKIIKVIASFFLLPLIGYTQAITFTKYYDFQLEETFNVLELNDGYLMTAPSGNTISTLNILIIKTDLYGDTVWVKRYGDTLQRFEIGSLIRTSDGNYITGSRLRSYTLFKQCIYLLKFDDKGDTLWSKKLFAPGSDAYYGFYIIECSDKGFLITGQQTDSLVTTGDVFITKTDSLGNYQWSKTFGGNMFDSGHSSVELPDKSFLSLGWTRSFSFGSRDLYIIKTDSLGNFIWQKHYGTTFLDGGTGITKATDGNYLLAGYKGNSSTGLVDAWLLKIDTAGIILWQKTLTNAGDAEIWWARELVDGTIVGAGSKSNPNFTLDSAWIVKTDGLGNKLWERGFVANNNYSYFRDVQPTSDGGFACVGFVYTGPSGNEDGWLIKLDSLGCDSSGCAQYTGVGIAELQPATAVQFYPNPLTTQSIVKFKNRFNEKVTLTLYDIMGNLIETQRTVSSDFIISKGNKADGVYFYNLLFDETNKVERGKFVVH